MDNHVNYIENIIAEQRSTLLSHPTYTCLQTLADLRIFTEFHVFAVWDFMSLLKSLQNHLTCTTIPWVPKGNAESRYLINEIVLGEESDVDEEGVKTSHFELYLKAMNNLGANTSIINNFIDSIQHHNIFKVIEDATLNQGIKRFLNFTFDIIYNKPPHIQSAVFTFGREDLIPDMFLKMLEKLQKENPSAIKTFKYYLERHIEVDGDHHKILALEMVKKLCGINQEYWKEAAFYANESLKIRCGLWDAILESVEKETTIAAF